MLKSFLVSFLSLCIRARLVPYELWRWLVPCSLQTSLEIDCRESAFLMWEVYLEFYAEPTSRLFLILLTCIFPKNYTLTSVPKTT